MRCLLHICFAIWLWGVASAQALEVRLAVLHGDVRLFAYEIGVIQMALDHADGRHRLTLIELPNVPQARILAMLDRNVDVNTFITGYAREREKRFFQVDIPITRGLLGHRVFMVHQRHENFFQSVKTQADLQSIKMGSGIGWMDTRVLLNAGFDVVTSTYQNLWGMLENGRFEAFNRGVAEVPLEWTRIKKAGKPLTLEPHVMVSYPFDAFIYVTRENPALYHVLKQGLIRAYETGAFLEYFRTHPSIRAMKDSVQPEKRHHIRLENPFLSPRIRKIAPSYWHKF